MTGSRRLGLDELMIVNPASTRSGVCFLGDDGMLYQVQGLASRDDAPGVGQFFLGDDGTLYQVQRLPPSRPIRPGACSLCSDRGLSNRFFWRGRHCLRGGHTRGFSVVIATSKIHRGGCHSTYRVKPGLKRICRLLESYLAKTPLRLGRCE